MGENDKKHSFSTETGSLKFGAGDLVVINDQECWSVPNLGIYDCLGKYLGETVEEAKETLDRRETSSGRKS